MKNNLLAIFIAVIMLKSLWYAPYTLCLPRLGLGSSSFLDGGPLRPKAGFYAQEYTQHYCASKVRDFDGVAIKQPIAPSIKGLSAAFQIVYQFSATFLNMSPGVDATIPVSLYSKISKNLLDIHDSGSGFGDLALGIYLQFNPIKVDKKPLLIHRIEFNASFPIGKNKEPKFNINPGNNFYFFNPYWAATFFMTRELSTSWRIYYLWCAPDKKTHVKAGDAFYGNYSLEYACNKKLIVGVNGYFLKQFKNDFFFEQEIPASKQQIFALGPGLLYLISSDIKFVFFANLYFEFHARNRPEGMRAVFRLFRSF